MFPYSDHILVEYYEYIRRLTGIVSSDKVFQRWVCESGVFGRKAKNSERVVVKPLYAWKGLSLLFSYRVWNVRWQNSRSATYTLRCAHIYNYSAFIS